jgi:sirohydrochlorin cobaltochelatase
MTSSAERNEDVPVLLVAHGSRMPEAAVEAERLRGAIDQVHPAGVILGYLELMEPSALQQAEKLLGSGVSEMIVQPLLLLPGNHARFDVTAVARHAMGLGAQVRLGQPLGSDARLLDQAQQHVRPHLPADAILVIASGTASEAALRSLDTSAALVAAGSGVAAVAATAATLDGQQALQALQALESDGHRSIVVVPWMLFPGRLETSTVAALQQGKATSTSLAVADRFGASAGTVAAVIKRLSAARTFAG